MKKWIGLLIVVGLAACASESPKMIRNCPSCQNIADVKTCGCPKKAPCGDCCGPEHCKCNPN